MRRKVFKNKFKRERTNKGCYFCEEKKTPIYKMGVDLERFTTDRGKILNRMLSGVCYKHQRPLTKAIKRARFLALIPFVTQIR